MLTTLLRGAPPPAGNIIWLKVSGTWKQATPFIKIAGTWRQADPLINLGGYW